MDIQSPQNARVKKWLKLHAKKGRDEQGLFLVEGEHLIQEALKAKRVETILIQEGCNHTFNHSDILICHESVLKKLSQNISGCEMLAICKIENSEIQNHRRILLMDNIQDPGNMGTMIRTAHAFGFDGVICSKDCVDVYNDKTIRSTQGALFLIPIQYDDLNKVIQELKNSGVVTIGTDLNGATEVSKLLSTNKMAFLFGNEGQGVKKELLAITDCRIKIEMKNFDSLNVAIAAGILMYQFR